MVPHWYFRHAVDWDYWTRNGEWVLFSFLADETFGDHGQHIDVRPAFFNFGANPWPVRVFFRCRGDH